MGIIHTAKRHIKEELCKKIRAEREFDENRQLSTAELTAIHRDAEKQAKEMNLNQVCLCFQAYVRHEADNSWVKICDPIYSKTVNNMKSALTGELRITRMSTYTSLVTGGQEVFMFVEKVCKSKSNKWQWRKEFTVRTSIRRYDVIATTNVKPCQTRSKTIAKTLISCFQITSKSDSSSWTRMDQRFGKISVSSTRQMCIINTGLCWRLLHIRSH